MKLYLDNQELHITAAADIFPEGTQTWDGNSGQDASDSAQNYSQGNNDDNDDYIEIEMRMAKIKNLNFWKCLEISRIVATSGSRKLRLALYFFFFCTLYTFLNHVYLPGPFNFYFLNLLQILLWALHTFLGVFGPLWDLWAASACGPQVATTCGRNEAPGEQPAHSEPFSSV